MRPYRAFRSLRHLFVGLSLLRSPNPISTGYEQCVSSYLTVRIRWVLRQDCTGIHLATRYGSSRVPHRVVFVRTLYVRVLFYGVSHYFVYAIVPSSYYVVIVDAHVCGAIFQVVVQRVYETSV